MGDAGREGVETLLGDPGRAIRRMSLPMIVALAVHSAYNLVDTVWVAGLGADALAAIGIAFPVFFTIIAFAHGLGVGTSSAVSRRIGAGDAEGRDRAAISGLAITLLFSLLLSLGLIAGHGSIYSAIGAEGEVLRLAMDYTLPYLLLSPVIFLSNYFNYVIMAEGDSRTAMRVMMLSEGVNIVIDPLFIYVFDLGIAGAAYATVLSMGVAASIMAHRFLVRRDTYIRLRLRGRLDRKAGRDVLSVGLPASVQELSLALQALSINAIILLVADADGVAVYNTGWRVLSLGIVPLVGISMALTPISGAAYGARRFGDLEVARSKAIRLGLLIEAVVCGLLFIFADQVVTAFTWAGDTSRLAEDIALFLRVVVPSCLVLTWGLLSTAVFMGTGKGTSALIGSILQFLLLGISIPFLMGVSLELGEIGIWAGIVAADAMGSFILYIWVRAYVRSLMGERSIDRSRDKVR